jgi:hypothetical protein
MPERVYGRETHTGQTSLHSGHVWDLPQYAEIPPRASDPIHLTPATPVSGESYPPLVRHEELGAVACLLGVVALVLAGPLQPAALVIAGVAAALGAVVVGRSHESHLNRTWPGGAAVVLAAAAIVVALVV